MGRRTAERSQEQNDSTAASVHRSDLFQPLQYTGVDLLFTGLCGKGRVGAILALFATFAPLIAFIVPTYLEKKCMGPCAAILLSIIICCCKMFQVFPPTEINGGAFYLF